MYHIFYKVTYILDGRYYYGSHSGTLTDSYRGSNKVIRAIQRKSGNTYLIRENLKTFNSRDECLAFEDRFLKFFNLKDNPNSLNFKNSAMGGDTWSGMSSEDRDIRKSLLSKKISGPNNGNFGKPMPEHRKIKMINSKIGVPIHTAEYKSQMSERIKREWQEGTRSNPFNGKFDNRKGKKNGDEWNEKIRQGVKNSDAHKQSRVKISQQRIQEHNNKLRNVKLDIEAGLTDLEILDKYKIKPITLYGWKKKIISRL